MGLLSSMLTGGAAGGFQAYGQVKDEEIKSAREAEKEAALTARMENMARLQREYQTSERLATQAFQTRNEAKELSEDASLAGYLRGDNQDLGGDAYSVKADAKDFKETMGAKGLLSIRALESAEQNKKDDSAYRDKKLLIDEKVADAQINKYNKDDSNGYKKQFEELSSIYGADKAKEILLSKTDKESFSRQKLAVDAYNDMIKSESGGIAPEPELIQRVNKRIYDIYGVDVNGFEKGAPASSSQRTGERKPIGSFGGSKTTATEEPYTVTKPIPKDSIFSKDPDVILKETAKAAVKRWGKAETNPEWFKKLTGNK